MWRLIAVGLGLLTYFKWDEIKEGLASLSAGMMQAPQPGAQGPQAGAQGPQGGAEIPRDDLKEIPGVGPALEKQLNELGIVSFRQIAMLQEADIDRIAAYFKAFKGRIRRDNWIESARRLHREKYGEQL